MPAVSHDATGTDQFLLSIGGMFLLLLLVGGSTYHILTALW